MSRFLFAAGLVTVSVVHSAESIPDPPSTFLANYCLDCHDELSEKGEINLDTVEIDWSDHASLFLWERVLKALGSGEMPPETEDQPSQEERDAMLAWLDGELEENTDFGGTLARRLNRVEYQATVEAIFGLKDFELPPGFPLDREYHGFDNVGEGLVLSPPLLEAYAETARLVADEIFPPERTIPEPSKWQARGKDLVISYSSGKLMDGALRLGMKCDPIQRSCTWPSRIEIETSGIYTVTMHLSTFRPAEGAPPMIAKVFARDVASTDGVSHRSLRLLKEIEVTDESPETFEFDAEIYEGQTPVVHWANAALDSDREDKADLVAFFEARGTADPRYLAAWHSMVSKGKGQGFRGGFGWDRVKAQLARDDLPEITEKQQDDLLKKVAGNPVLYAETIVFDVFENGPALEVHGLEIEGPHQVVEGPLDRERQKMQTAFLGDHAEAREAVLAFLTRAFRRPVDEATLATFLALHDQHRGKGHTAGEAMHLVIRNALISPRFLYRSLDDGPLDDHDLATRLAYFLTSRPPDSKLREKALAGSLSDPGVLRSQAERLLPQSPGAPLVTHFTGQWLDTRLLPEIMPDPRFKFSPGDINSATREAEYFFAEILRENRPMKDFIDPDFTWTSARIARDVYGLEKGFDKKKTNTVHRIPLPRGGRYGGLLGQSAVMMATANGVDTQPVLRGVWVLENIMGMSPPPPPKSVPALTPDTQGATTPRDLLSAHTASESCAGCHRKIDPVGFALENFDPVGRWRENWPGIEQPIDASATMHDGTEITGVVDLKGWLVENIDQFSACLAEKLLTYATGRVPNYTERQEIASIVRSNHEDGNGFRDLVLGLIESETFRTK